VNHVVLSGTATHVLSGTRSSCYRGPESCECFSYSTTCRARNFSNPESFGFFLTNPTVSAAGDLRQPAARNDTIGALLGKSAGGKTILALLLAGFLARQFLCGGGVA
jgi:hypothetical protein